MKKVDIDHYEKLTKTWVDVFFKQFERAEYKVSILQRMKDVLPFFKGKTDEEVPLIDGLVIKPQMLHMAVVNTP